MKKVLIVIIAAFTLAYIVDLVIEPQLNAESQLKIEYSSDRFLLEASSSWTGSAESLSTPKDQGNSTVSYPENPTEVNLTNLPVSTHVIEPILTPNPNLNKESLIVGDSYYLGRYEQNNISNDGTEEIEWIVLAKDTNGVLLISKYVLDCVPYNTERADTSWETCTLRQWLNGQFFQSAFTLEEQSGILAVTLDNESNPIHHIGEGRSTVDRIFALSASEAKKHLTAENLNTPGTRYARANGAKFRNKNRDELYDNKVYWWLRTTGKQLNYAMITSVQSNNLDYDGNAVGAIFDGGNPNNTGVRPSLWLSWNYIGKHSS